MHSLPILPTSKPGTFAKLLPVPSALLANPNHVRPDQRSVLERLGCLFVEAGFNLFQHPELPLKYVQPFDLSGIGSALQFRSVLLQVRQLH